MKRRVLTCIAIGMLAVVVSACYGGPEESDTHRLRFSESMKLSGLAQAGTAATGSQACPDILSCLSQCSDSDFSCALTCFAAGSSKGQQDILALLSCTEAAVDGSCGSKCVYLFGDACEACVNGLCQAEIDACVASPPSNPDAGVVPDSTPSPDASPSPSPDAAPTPPPSTGGYSCVDIHDCLDGCTVMDETCVSDCYAAASTEAQGQFQALYGCVQDAAGNQCATDCGSTDAEWFSAACQSCLQNGCLTELDACFNPAPSCPNPPSTNPPCPPQGTQTCAEVLTCLESCTEEICANDCLRNAAPDAQTLFMTAADCVQAALAGTCQADCQNPNDAACNSCYNKQCAAEINACVGNGP